MKNFYFLFLSSVVFFESNAQSAFPTPFECTPEYYCQLDLRDPLFTLAETDSIVNQSYAKSPQNSLFHDVEYTDDSPEACETETDCLESSEALIFNVYYPKNTVYTHYNTCPLPVLFLYHPGGYSDCSTLDGTKDMKFICKEFAKRGYVVFDVEYRRGRLLFPTEDIFVQLRRKTVQQILAIYRAVQDVRGSIRTF